MRAMSCAGSCRRVSTAAPASRPMRYSPDCERAMQVPAEVRTPHHIVCGARNLWRPIEKFIGTNKIVLPAKAGTHSERWGLALAPRLRGGDGGVCRSDLKLALGTTL